MTGRPTPIMRIIGGAGQSDPRRTLQRSESGACSFSVQFADVLSRPRLFRGRRRVGYGLRFADNPSRPRLRPLRTPGLAGTAARSVWSSIRRRPQPSPPGAGTAARSVWSPWPPVQEPWASDAVAHHARRRAVGFRVNPSGHRSAWRILEGRFFQTSWKSGLRRFQAGFRPFMPLLY